MVNQQQQQSQSRPSRRPWQSHMDMYRKIPTDLLDGSKRGSIFSFLSLLGMIILFGWESYDFFYVSKVVTDLALDRVPSMENKENIPSLDKSQLLRLNFNITMTDLSCDFAVIDVISVLGTDQNVTAHITKWSVASDTLYRKGYKGRNRNQKDIELHDSAVEDTLEELHEDGEDATVVEGSDALEVLLKDYDYVFVDFFAAWCSHCQTLAPTWEALAEVMTEASTTLVEEEQEKIIKDLEEQDKIRGSGTHHVDQHSFTGADYRHAIDVTLPVVIAKVDCVSPKNQYLCNQQEQIRVYPTLRLFIDGKPWEGGSDYKGHRTVMEMVDWLKHMEEQHKSAMVPVGEMENPMRTLHTAHEAAKEYMGVDSNYQNKNTNNKANANANLGPVYNGWKDDEQSVGGGRGCQLSGHLLLDRVPGNFHILARSKHHDLNPHLTNVSHIVNSLSIGSPSASGGSNRYRNYQQALNTNDNSILPDTVHSKLTPMDGNVYTTYNLHESYHHYLKVVTTKQSSSLNSAASATNRDVASNTNLYQILPNTQLSYYKSDIVPEAKFVYDLSPISVNYRKESRQWYQYITSLFAIIGGVFTMVGMIESTIHSAVVKVKKSKKVAPGSAQNRYR
mmetsp:Transcript_21392/g.24597  ORF Transcript_21392/g.24597 Transcript_21392/m.24597 type:complete len:619 (+) Transcript_21392:81-1937(+)